VVVDVDFSARHDRVEKFVVDVLGLNDASIACRRRSARAFCTGGESVPTILPHASVIVRQPPKIDSGTSRR